MSDKRKLGPVRQLSLQSENQRIRPILKKQLSVEQLDRLDEHKTHQPRVESAKNKLHDRPRPIKVAWAENRTNKDSEIPQHKGKFSDTVEVKKCKEHKRPTTAKLRSQSSIEKESILCTRQELAERLRKAWKEREDNKQNLDIFLTQHHQTDNKNFDDLENENYYPEYEETRVFDKNINTTEDEIIAQFKPTNFMTHNNTKNINTNHKKNSETEFNYIPSTTSSRPQDVRTITNLSVTIPSVNSLIRQQPIQDNQDVSPPVETTKKPEENSKKSSLMSPKENLPPARPHTASSASKREGFQKRTNSAFTGSITSSITGSITGSISASITPNIEKNPVRPPLIRALSVPVRSENNNKLKFIATKRRLKSARKRTNNPENPDENDDNKTNKKGSRCKSAPNGDVVTMVSLVSPAGSDTEEIPEKGRNLSPVKNQQSNLENVNKSIALRKSVKSVSFQQSSIHAVRSFSASFPARRGILTSSASVITIPEREKRAPATAMAMESTPGEFRGPKRRLVKSLSVATADEDMNERIKPQDSFEETKFEETKSIQSSTDEDPIEEQVQIPEKDEDEKEAETFDPNMPKFETNKEKECWIMFKKMSDKGLPVSFDTILRGMLTPTEYRSVRKEMQNAS